MVAGWLYCRFIDLFDKQRGIKTGRIQGAPDFFSITKNMNKALHGGDFNLAEMNMEIYEDGGLEELDSKTILEGHDCVDIMTNLTSVIQRLEQFTGVAGEFH